MKIAFILLLLFLLVIAPGGITLVKKYKTAQKLVDIAKPYERLTEDHTTSLLVLGDSVAVGVGARTPEESTVGLFAQEIGATYVENKSVSGATIEDLKGQLSSIQRAEYTHIFLQIGGNDIIRFHTLEDDRTLLKEVLTLLPTTDNLTVLSMGNVGTASFFPRFMRPLYIKRSLAYHAMFEELFERHPGTYINLYMPPSDDLFLQHPEIYLSPDGLHPSSEGYRLWFNKIKTVL